MVAGGRASLVVLSTCGAAQERLAKACWEKSLIRIFGKGRKRWGGQGGRGISVKLGLNRKVQAVCSDVASSFVQRSHFVPRQGAGSTSKGF